MNKQVLEVVALMCMGIVIVSLITTGTIFFDLGGAASWPKEGEPTTTVPTTGPTNTEPTGENSKFSFTLYGEDTSSAVSSMTVTAWYDANGDTKMTADELRLCADSSGTYTSGKEYPIGPYIWIQAYGTNYQTAYFKVHMTGQRNSDGSAKLVEEACYIRATDDSVTYNGLINNIGWDDSTDYNYTLSGTSGTAKVSVVLSAADKGLSSRIWDNAPGGSYKTVYSTIFAASPNIDINNYVKEFWLKWDSIGIDNTITKSAILAPDFFGLYMTIQDKIDLAPTVTDFDLYGDDNTNFYMASYVTDGWGDLIYNTADPSAPQPTIDFQVGTITAAGTTVATYGVAIHTGLTYEQMVSFLWTASAAYYLGTPGSDWDWVA